MDLKAIWEMSVQMKSLLAIVAVASSRHPFFSGIFFGRIKVKELNCFILFLSIFFLLGCVKLAQPMSPSYSSTTYEGTYTRVIKGGLGFNFGVMDTTVLKEKGFRKILHIRYYSDIGKWESSDYKDNFFNFGVEIAVSPISKMVKHISGKRFYGAKAYIAHFASCMDDYRAIITQLKSKYPTLVQGSYIYDLASSYKPGEYATSTYNEGFTRSKYGSQRKYIGRFITVTCSIQTWKDKTIIGSLLIVSYSEAFDITKGISDEQKELFKDKSEEILRKKGLGKDKL